MELNYNNRVKRFRNSSEQWIMPIPIVEDGELKIICFMNHDKENRVADNEPIWFDAYYTYKTSLLVLHNFLLEESCGKAYWKYVRCKEPRTSFLGLNDFKKNTYITEKSIQNIMIKGRTNYIFELIDKKFDNIEHKFTTHPFRDDDMDEIDPSEMGYDY